MRSLFVLFSGLLLLAAQSGVDYAITNVRDPVLSADGTTVEVAFDVINLGEDADAVATVRVTNPETGDVLATQELEPLPGGSGLTVTISFPVERLPETGSQTLNLVVSIDRFDTNIDNNRGQVILLPLDQLEQRPAATPEPEPDSQPINGGLTLIGFTFNTNDPLHIAALVLLSVALLVMLAMLIIIIRLLFRRRPVFQIEPPPYANTPALAPSTNAGRRQGWQFHAQNDLPPPYHASEAATHIRKLLTGMDSQKFANWTISGLRLSQYDQYGRISRSEVIAKKRLTRRLTRIAERAKEADAEKLERWLRPLARSLARNFIGNINRRSSILPIALDLRFEGGHGEVRIFFELYHMEQGRWQRVDAWEPEMMVRGPLIHEHFTYTLAGLQPGENFKAFSQRLSSDMTGLLTSMLRHDPPAPASSLEDTGPAAH